MSQRQVLVTAALPYSNGRPHVGHIAGAYLPADIYVRYLRAVGANVRFICGSDDNGVALTLAAQKEGLTPEQTVAKYNAAQKRAFDAIGISFDVYGGTHMPGFYERHTELSHEFFRSIHDKGYFTKKTSQQLYDVQADKFLPDRYVTGICHHPDCRKPGAYGDQCEHCGRDIDPLLLGEPKSIFTGTTPVVRDTVHWYLRLDQFEGELRRWLESRTDWRPTVVNFALGLIKGKLHERAMTRDLSWGIPVPLDDPDAAGKVLYVWFDAPIGYVSFTDTLLIREGGKPGDYADWWKNPDCPIVHFIGEDNIIFHAIIWPAMLMAEGSYQLPSQVVANSFLNIKFPGDAEEQKISKSRGTAVWIEDYLADRDPDPLRYYLTAIAPEGARTAYDADDLVQRNDGELVAALGNFINRTTTFAQKYFDQKVPAAGTRQAIDEEQLARCRSATERVAAELEAFHFKAALGELMELARDSNQYFARKQPWAERKTSLEACGVSINVGLQTIRTLMTLMAPFLPFSAAKLAAMLNLPADRFPWDQATTPLPDGHPLGEPAILFKKLADA